MMRRHVLITLAVWLVATVAYGSLTVAGKLALPSTGDSYANTVQFQTLWFIAFKGPSLLSVLLVTLASVVFLVRMRESVLETRARGMLLATFWLFAAIALVGMFRAGAASLPGTNPYFEQSEEFVLQFMLTWLPLLAVFGIAVLGLECIWLKRRAR